MPLKDGLQLEGHLQVLKEQGLRGFCMWVMITKKMTQVALFTNVQPSSPFSPNGCVLKHNFSQYYKNYFTDSETHYNLFRHYTIAAF